MPSESTTVTELGTALGMLGLDGIDEAVRSRTPVMHSLSPEAWDRLARLRTGGAYDAEFQAREGGCCLAQAQRRLATASEVPARGR